MQLAAFVNVLRLHLAEHVADLCEVVKSNWSPQLLASLKLLEACAVAFQSLLLPFIPAFTVLITSVLRNDSSQTGRLQRVQRVLDVLLALSPLHEPHFHLIAPVLASLISSESEAVEVKRAAVRSLGQLATRVDLTPHISRLLVAVARSLPRHAELRLEAISTIGALFDSVHAF